MNLLKKLFGKGNQLPQRQSIEGEIVTHEPSVQGKGLTNESNDKQLVKCEEVEQARHRINVDAYPKNKAEKLLFSAPSIGHPDGAQGALQRCPILYLSLSSVPYRCDVSRFAFQATLLVLDNI